MAAVTLSPVSGATDPETAADPPEPVAVAPAPSPAEAVAEGGLVCAGAGAASVAAEHPARAVSIPHEDPATAHRAQIPHLVMRSAAGQGAGRLFTG
jgi:hypothetical protein